MRMGGVKTIVLLQSFITAADRSSSWISTVGSLPPPPDDSTVSLVELSSTDQRYKYVEEQVSTYSVWHTGACLGLEPLTGSGGRFCNSMLTQHCLRLFPTSPFSPLLPLLLCVWFRCSTPFVHTRAMPEGSSPHTTL